MFIYMGLGFVYAMLGIWESDKSLNLKSRMIFLFFLLFPMFFLTAFRDVTIGTDTVQYSRIYTNITSISSYLQNSYLEPGYIALNYLSKSLGLTYYHFQVLVGIFTYAGIYRFMFKYSENLSYSCFLFLMMRLMFSIMNISRSWIATIIALFAIEFIKKRKLKEYVLVISIAALLLHTSAFILLIVYPISMIDLNKKRMLQFLSISFMIFLIGQPVFLAISRLIGRYENFLTGKAVESGIAVWITLCIHLGFFMFAIYTGIPQRIRVEENKSSEISSTKIFFAASFTLICLDIIGLRINVFNRLTTHFLPFLIIMVSNSLRNSFKNIEFYILVFLMTVLMIAYFIIVLIYRPEWNQVLPYKFFWN